MKSSAQLSKKTSRHKCINDALLEAFVSASNNKYTFVREGVPAVTFRNTNLPRSQPFRADCMCVNFFRDQKLMVEYNGPYHYRKYESTRTRNDVMKRDWCLKNGYIQINVNPVIKKTKLVQYACFRLMVDANYTDVAYVSPITCSLIPRAVIGSKNVRKDTLQYERENPNDGNVELYLADSFKLKSREEIDFHCKTSFREADYLRSFLDSCLGEYFGQEGSRIKTQDRGHIVCFPPDKYGRVCSYVSFILIAPKVSLTVLLWKNCPPFGLSYPGGEIIHVPLYLLTNLRSLAKYLSCRILDECKYACENWKLPWDPFQQR